jgi:hypothetical protein
MLTQAPTDAASSTSRALALLQSGKLDEAEALLGTLLAATPGDGNLQANLGLIAFRRRDMPRAREILGRAVSSAPDNAAAHSNLAAVLAELTEFDLAEQHARRALELDSSDTEALITLAESLVARERYDEAEQCYAVAAAAERWRVAGEVRFGKASFEAACRAESVATLPPIRTLVGPPANAASHVLFLACSPDYLDRYAGSLLESLSANGGGGSLLHLHVVGGDEHLVQRLLSVPVRYHRVPMTITAESPDLSGMSSSQRTTFFTGARFLRVPDLLDEYRRPVVTLDIDAIIEGPTQQLIEVAAGGDLALMLRMPQRIVWTNVLAGVVVFNPTAKARAYARLVKGFILTSVAEGRLTWNLDQIALFCSLVMQGKFAEAPVVHAVNAAAERVIYQLSPLRGEKVEDRKYLEYFAEI